MRMGTVVVPASAFPTRRSYSGGVNRGVIWQITPLARPCATRNLCRMIELRLFGGFEMTGPDRERARSVAAQPRRSALLAYLAIQGLRGPVRRDQLTALFWPDAEP